LQDGCSEIAARKAADLLAESLSGRLSITDYLTSPEFDYSALPNSKDMRRRIAAASRPRPPDAARVLRGHPPSASSPYRPASTA